MNNYYNFFSQLINISGLHHVRESNLRSNFMMKRHSAYYSFILTFSYKYKDFLLNKSTGIKLQWFFFISPETDFPSEADTVLKIHTVHPI